MDEKQVVVAYDFSETADVALERAVDLAGRAPQHVLHVVAAIDPRFGFGLDRDEAVDYRYAEKIHDEVLARVRDALAARLGERDIEFCVHARIGEPADEILGLAEDVGADMIIIGSHGRSGLQRVLLGSVSETIVRKAGCPVIVARPKLYDDVARERVVEVSQDTPRRWVRPHRYSYTGGGALTRPADWPMN